MHFVYVLQSESTGRFYVGQTDDLIRRFNQHRAGYNKSTRGRGPWTMPYYEAFPTRQQACARECQIKAKKSADYIRSLIQAAW